MRSADETYTDLVDLLGEAAAQAVYERHFDTDPET